MNLKVTARRQLEQNIIVSLVMYVCPIEATTYIYFFLLLSVTIHYIGFRITQRKIQIIYDTMLHQMLLFIN